MFDKLRILNDDEVYVETELVPKVRPRTPFVALTPFGVGTSNVESLDSYFERLADAHRLSPVTLFKEMLSARLGNYSATWKQSSAYLLQGAKAMNGYGSLSNAWVKVLTELTSVSSLQFCGLTAIENILSFEGLFSPKIRFCPHCIAAATDYTELYKRLLWTIYAVDACPIHRIRLIEHLCECPNSKILHFQFRKILFGVCSRCGSIGYQCDKRQVQPASKIEIWRAVQVGQLLSLLPDAERIFSKRRLMVGIHLVSRSLGDGKAFAGLRASELSKGTVYTWINGSAPRLDLLLNLCGAADISLVSVMRGIPEPSKHEGGGVQPRKYIRRTGPTIESRRRALELAVGSADPPPSVSAVARSIGVDRNDLTRKFPGLTAQIAARYLEYQRNQRMLRRDRLIEECRPILDKLKKNGIKPTYKRIQSESGVPNLPQSLLRRVLDEIIDNQEE